jgi:cytochrome c-type biogenesis protein CcmH
MAPAVALAAVLLLSGCAADEVADTQSAIEERLTCQCGCGLTVHTCNHLQCSFAIPVKKDIAASLAAGQSADEILDRYVAEYGEKILSSPTREGFNLLAWYGPYVAIVASGVLIVWLLLRWRRTTPREEASTVPSSTGISGPDRRRIDEELERFEA